MSLSQSIRGVMAASPNLSVEEVRAKLATKGIIVNAQLVYNVRAGLKKDAQSVSDRKKQQTDKMKETIAKNAKPLREYIKEALQFTELLSVGEVGERCRKNGYISEPVNYLTNVRKKLDFLIDKGIVYKSGDKYGLVNREQKVSGNSHTLPDDNGVAYLVAKLKKIVSQIGREETKQLVDVL